MIFFGFVYILSVYKCNCLCSLKLVQLCNHLKVKIIKTSIVEIVFSNKINFELIVRYLMLEKK
jgi:hypothetical protein